MGAIAPTASTTRAAPTRPRWDEGPRIWREVKLALVLVHPRARDAQDSGHCSGVRKVCESSGIVAIPMIELSSFAGHNAGQSSAPQCG
jgi:hypothetical protein